MRSEMKWNLVSCELWVKIFFWKCDTHTHTHTFVLNRIKDFLKSRKIGLYRISYHPVEKNRITTGQLIDFISGPLDRFRSQNILFMVNRIEWIIWRTGSRIFFLFFFSSSSNRCWCNTSIQIQIHPHLHATTKWMHWMWKKLFNWMNMGRVDVAIVM